MDIKTLLKTTPQTLAAEQYKALKEFATSRLVNVVSCLDNENFDQIKPMMEYSPAGDGYGTDHWFIDFPVFGDSDGTDLIEIIEHLQKLQTIMKST